MTKEQNAPSKEEGERDTLGESKAIVEKVVLPHFYESEWEPDKIPMTEDEKVFVEALGWFLPRHMPPYDWNRPFAEMILLITRETLTSRTRKVATEEAWREAGKEQIICAAIRAKNGKLYPCAYHGQGIEQRAYQQKYYGDDGYAEDAQGFITSRNRFVDRVEGLAIALEAGQVEENRHGKDELMSEDLPYNRFENLIQAAKERGVNVEI